MSQLNLDSQWPDDVGANATAVWIPLADYSMKYRVSQSTLRRRIRADEIEYQFSDGKYLLPDQPWELIQKMSEKPGLPRTSPPQAPQGRAELPNNELVDGLLGEIKKAYALVLQEKEQMIMQLREEMTDLKTLVRVLEEENQRLAQSAKLGESIYGNSPQGMDV